MRLFPRRFQPVTNNTGASSVNGFSQYNKAQINAISTLSNLMDELYPSYVMEPRSLHAAFPTSIPTSE